MYRLACFYRPSLYKTHQVYLFYFDLDLLGYLILAALVLTLAAFDQVLVAAVVGLFLHTQRSSILLLVFACLLHLLLH